MTTKEVMITACQKLAGH